MGRLSFEDAVSDFICGNEKNTAEGVRIFDRPLFGYGSAKDPLYASFKGNAEANLPYLILPEEWLPGARTVISVFVPFTDAVRKSNRGGTDASLGWAVGRMEGQNLLSEAAGFAVGFLEGEGAPAVMPLCDRRMQVAKKPGSNPNLPPDAHYTSTWSERHNGFICGLGTFGLSKGLITAKGMAGRMFSIITEAVFPITERGYTGLYEYCTGCGACIKRCPAGAITAKGKDHELCVDIILRSMVTLAPRYGCGKCQCGVPCEAGIPAKGRR